ETAMWSVPVSITRAKWPTTAEAKRVFFSEGGVKFRSNCRCGIAVSLLLRAQRAADDLAGGGQRQLLHELDDARVLVGGKARADVLLELGLQGIARGESRLEHDDRLHHLGADRVGLAHHGGERDRG